MHNRMSRPGWLGLAAGLAWLLVIVVALAWAANRPVAPGPAVTSAAATLPPAATQPPAGTATAGPAKTPTAPAPAAPSGPAPAPTPWARVSANAPGLRLRKAPGTAADVIRELPAATAMAVVGRTADNAWLQVVTAQGEQGWVAATYLDLFATLDQLPVTGTAANVAAIPYISGITAHARQVYLAGQALGNHVYAFSPVGDSNTDNPAFLAPFDTGNYDLGKYADLQAAITFFKGSFARHSAAAVGGFSTAKVLDPANADNRCSSGETPLACEYRLQKPSVALILLGTGDQHDWQHFEGRYRQIIEYTLAQGIVPVLITKADDLESKEDTAASGYINGVIVRLSHEYDVPLLDLRQAIDPLPNRGLKPDGFHYNLPPDGLTANFTGDHLNYGFTVRNLTALQMLDALRRYVLY
jgi:uncharacterized protein YraI